MARSGRAAQPQLAEVVDTSLPFKEAKERWNDHFERRYVAMVFADARAATSRAPRSTPACRAGTSASCSTSTASSSGRPTTATATDRRDHAFGAYEILHELKSGGMGAVLLGAPRAARARSSSSSRSRRSAPEYARAPAVRAMFLDEAAILARLNHPGIATVHDFGEEAGTLYMVMEYVAGISFRDLVEHRLPPAVAARAIAEACRGLHAAHELRDLGGQRARASSIATSAPTT